MGRDIQKVPEAVYLLKVEYVRTTGEVYSDDVYAHTFLGPYASIGAAKGMKTRESGARKRITILTLVGEWTEAEL